MPVISTPDHNQRIVHTVCSELVTLGEIEQYQYNVWLEPAIYGYNELFDMVNSDFSQIDFGDLISVAQAESKLYMLDPMSRFAFLTATSHHQQVADFYISTKSLIKCPSRDLKSFNSRQKALTWLTEKYR